MGVARLRWVGFAALLVVLVGGCRRPGPTPPEAPAESTSPAAASPPENPAATGANGVTLTARAPDAFYAPPADVPPVPGMLLRSQPLRDVTLPAGLQGWRILYSTTVDDRTPATAVATVFASVESFAGPRPVVTWEHSTTGVLQKCMPSLFSDPTLGIPARERIAAAGWVVIATDYSFAEENGPHPYLIGEGEARAALDAVRAARRMPELQLDARTVVWGHSQGGHAALWTGIVGPRYAPDVEILGVVAIAPVADMTNILAMNLAIDKGLGPYLALSYSRFYPDLRFEDAVQPVAFEAARRMTNLCLVAPAEDPQRLAAYSEKFYGPALATGTNPVLASRLEQNTPTGTVAAPLLIAQGRRDKVVPPRATDTYVQGRCAAGQRLEYWSFPRADHNTIVQPGTPLDQPLTAWTAARFANEPQASGCARRTF
jgi:acetyl esterase/lipase